MIPVKLIALHPLSSALKTLLLSSKFLEACCRLRKLFFFSSPLAHVSLLLGQIGPIKIFCLNTSTPCSVACHVGLWNPMDCRPPGSSLHGISQERRLEWVAIFVLRGIFLIQGSNLCLLHWQVGSLPLVPPEKPYNNYIWGKYHPNNR